MHSKWKLQIFEIYGFYFYFFVFENVKSNNQ